MREQRGIGTIVIEQRVKEALPAGILRVAAQSWSSSLVPVDFPWGLRKARARPLHSRSRYGEKQGKEPILRRVLDYRKRLFDIVHDLQL